MTKRAPGKLKRWRMANGLTHEAAGALFNTTRVTWFRWEAGMMIPSPPHMIALYLEGITEPNDFYELPDRRAFIAARDAEIEPMLFKDVA